MDTLKKVFMSIVYVVLLGGSITGVVFGVEYNNLNQSSKSEYVVVLENENKQLNEEKTNLQTQVVILDELISQKDEQITNLESANLKNIVLINSLKAEKQSLLAEKTRLENLLVEKEEEIADLYYQILTLANERLSMSVSSKKVDSVVRGEACEIAPNQYLVSDIYQVSEEANDLYVGTDENKVILNVSLNFVVGSYFNVKSTSSNIHIDRVIPTTLETPGYYNPRNQVGIDSVSSNMYYLVYTEGVVEEITQEVLTISLYDYKDRLLKSVNYTLTLHPQTSEPFNGFTTEEITLISASVKGSNAGRIDGLESYYVEGENLRLLFNGVDGYGNKGYFITYVTGYAEGLTSTDVCDMINMQGNGSEFYSLLYLLVEHDNVDLRVDDFDTDYTSVVVNYNVELKKTSSIITIKIGFVMDDVFIIKTFIEQVSGNVSGEPDYTLILSKVLSFAV